MNSCIEYEELKCAIIFLFHENIYNHWHQSVNSWGSSTLSPRLLSYVNLLITIVYTNVLYYIFVDHTLTNLVYKNTWINVSNKLLNVYTRVIEIVVLG